MPDLAARHSTPVSNRSVFVSSSNGRRGTTRFLAAASRRCCHETDQAEEFKQRVLKRCRSEEQLVSLTQRKLQGVGDDVCRFIDVAESMRFVDDYQGPTAGRLHKKPCCARTDRTSKVLSLLLQSYQRTHNRGVRETRWPSLQFQNLVRVQFATSLFTALLDAT